MKVEQSGCRVCGVNWGYEWRGLPGSLMVQLCCGCWSDYFAAFLADKDMAKFWEAEHALQASLKGGHPMQARIAQRAKLKTELVLRPRIETWIAREANRRAATRPTPAPKPAQEPVFDLEADCPAIKH